MLPCRLPTAKAAKTEGSADIKAFIENLLQGGAKGYPVRAHAL